MRIENWELRTWESRVTHHVLLPCLLCPGCLQGLQVLELWVQLVDPGRARLHVGVVLAQELDGGLARAEALENLNFNLCFYLCGKKCCSQISKPQSAVLFDKIINLCRDFAAILCKLVRKAPQNCRKIFYNPTKLSALCVWLGRPYTWMQQFAHLFASLATSSSSLSTSGFLAVLGRVFSTEGRTCFTSSWEKKRDR